MDNFIMDDANLLGILLGTVLVIFAVLLIKARWVYQTFSQLKTNRERNKAYSGKLKCQHAGCEAVANYVTPHGYFCDWHWEPMSVLRRDGIRVTWAHRIGGASK